MCLVGSVIVSLDTLNNQWKFSNIAFYLPIVLQQPPKIDEIMQDADRQFMDLAPTRRRREAFTSVDFTCHSGLQ